MRLFGKDYDNEARIEIKRIRERLFGDDNHQKCLNINPDGCYENGEVGILSHLQKQINDLKEKVKKLERKKKR